MGNSLHEGTEDSGLRISLRNGESFNLTAHKLLKQVVENV